jgi:thioredoxin reductase (NADPH)
LDSEIGRDAQGFIETNSTLETAKKGVWAIGAVRSGFGGTLNDAVEDVRSVAAAIKSTLGR